MSGSDSQRWARVRGVLEEALERSGEERSRYLEEACGDDADLAAEVRRLLALEHEAHRLEPPHGDPSAETTRPDSGSEPVRIGPWELVREVGRGGMGIVWLARRADGAYQRRVALKVLHRNAGDAHVLERFRRERQVLANLDHPGIARLLEGGETRDGRPFLVMEYVEGRPIDRYCDEERLPLAARLELFRQVCQAVQYAHANLVVHRDLKPANVLVTARGEPKLLDFGIAKVLDPEKTSAAPEVTVGVMRFMTPAYASPEQVTGRAITTASDVYSLGVLLYRLLVDALPHEVETTSAAEIERIVCQEEPRRPTEVLDQAGPQRAQEVARARLTTPRALRRAVAGDLERIVLAALRKEPWRRYPSVQALGDDVRRFLQGLPISARPDTWSYRVSRFVRRNRGAAVTAGFVALALVGGLAATGRQYVLARRARTDEHAMRTLAESRLSEARRLASDLEEQRTAAEQRLAEVEQLNRQLDAERRLAQERFDDVRGLATTLIFDIHRAISRLEGATPAIELVVSSGLGALDRLAQQAGDDPELARDLVNAYLRMAEIQADPQVANLGRRDDARASVTKALALTRELLEAGAEDPGNHSLLAQALVRRGDLLLLDGHVTSAKADYQAAVDACLPIEESANPMPGHLYVVHLAKSRLADRLVLEGDSRGCDLYRECLSILVRLVEGWPSLAPIECEVGLVHGSLAGWHLSRGQIASALAEYEEAEEVFERTASLRQHDASMQRAVHAIRDGRAEALFQAGQEARALEIMEDSRRFFAQAARRNPENVLALQDLGTCLGQIADMRIRQNDWVAARDAADEQRTACESLLQRDPGNARVQVLLAEALASLGTVAAAQRDWVEAGRNLDRAAGLAEALLATDEEWPRAIRLRCSVKLMLGRAQLDAAQEQGLHSVALVERARDALEEALRDARRLEARGLPSAGPERVRAELARCDSLSGGG